MRLNRDEVDPVGHATDVFTEWAIEYLGERKDQPNGGDLGAGASNGPLRGGKTQSAGRLVGSWTLRNMSLESLVQTS